MIQIKKTNIFIFTSVLVLCVLFFFKSTADSVLTVHDDILTYMQVRQGTLWQTALDDAKHGRICHIPLTFLLYIPYMFNSVLMVRIFSMAAVLFDMTALYKLIKNNTDSYSAYLSCLLFIAFACISNQHNLLVSYIIGHQIPIGIMLFSINSFTEYYNSKHKTSTLIKSALLFFAASFLYEACAAYILIFIFIAMYKNNGNIFRNCTRIIYDTHFHFLLLFLYTLIYFGWRKFYPSDYEGAKLYFGDIPQSFITMIKYSAGMIPGLPALAMVVKKYITFEEFRSALNIGNIVVPLITAITFYFVFPKIKNPKNKLACALLCIAGIIIPNLIISFTPKYAEWTKGSSYSYVTSFYSYFFMIPLFLIVLKTIFRNNSKPVMIFLSSIVFCISFVSSAGNTAWNVYFGKNLERYKAFSAAVSSSYFDNLEDGTTVYIPDYTGIHNSMDITKSFAAIYTSADINFTNKIETIDFSHPAVFLKYSPEDKSMTAGNLNADGSFSDCFCIYGNSNITCEYN